MFSIESRHDPEEQKWLNYFYECTPNGDLYAHNSLHAAVEKENIVLVHATQSLDSIKRSGLLYPSVGCLGATIYATPLNLDGKLHNFTQYIIDSEIPAINRITPKETKHISLIGIKVKTKFTKTNKSLAQFNYLYLGPMQFDIYIQTKRNFHTSEHNVVFGEFENDVVHQIQFARPFLNICSDVAAIPNDEFFSGFEAAVGVMPLLGYVYFETLSEYVQLLQQDSDSVTQRERGELAIKHLKDLVYTLTPSLSDGFDLEKFQPSIDAVIDALIIMNKERGLFVDFNEYSFKTFMKKRLSQTIWIKLMNKEIIPDNITFDTNISLSGHIVHRLIGDKQSMRPFLWDYDMLRAEYIWSDWSQRGVIVIENTVLPRGEVGINPLIPPKEYEIYELHQDVKSGVVTFGERLNVRIAKALVDGNSLMGSSNNPKKENTV